MKIINNLVTIAVAALLLTTASCGNKSTSENDSAVQAGNFFSSVAEKMQEQLGASLKASDYYIVAVRFCNQNFSE